MCSGPCAVSSAEVQFAWWMQAKTMLTRFGETIGAGALEGLGGRRDVRATGFTTWNHPESEVIAMTNSFDTKKGSTVTCRCGGMYVDFSHSVIEHNLMGGVQRNTSHELGGV